ncbi:hypothetical protein, partial [Ovoidimarina sediminis]|uniref:hypothetical protein n=1 Tax=Ovoidimarina sediminis TaxID=3079856 RepID=UPI002910F2D5
ISWNHNEPGPPLQIKPPCPKSSDDGQLVEADTHFGGNEEGHPGTSTRIDTTNLDNWDEGIEWLYVTASKWISATDKLFGNSPDRASKYVWGEDDVRIIE